MNEIQRSIFRSIDVIAIGVGIVGVIRPFKTYEMDSLYDVTSYSRQTGSTISEKVQTGAELMTNQRWGAVAVILRGAFCLFAFRKDT